MVLLVSVVGWSYWIALPFGLLVALLLGFQIERGMLGPLRKAPRMIVTVATIGVSQILGAMTLYISGTAIDFFGLFSIPPIFDVPTQIGSAVQFHFPWEYHFQLRGLIITSDYFVALAAVPLVLVGLSWYFNRTDSGIGARAAADSEERALLLGLPVRRLTLVTWLVASAMSYLGVVLLAGVNGFQSSIPSGPEALTVPLAAAVIAGFDSLAIAFLASVVIGIIQNAIFWNYPQASLVDLVVFLLIVATLLLRRQAAGRVGGEDLGGFVGLSEVRPLPAAIAAFREVRVGKVAGLCVIVAACWLVPLLLSSATLTFLSFVAIFTIVAASLIMLAGWGGQISLGHFGLVGLGAGTTGWLLVGHHVPLLACLAASSAVGAAAALVIGLPALRIRGLYLAVVTLAFAAPASTFFLNSNRFPSLAPVRIEPPVLFNRFDLSQARPFYYFCLLLAFIAFGIARNFRNSRIGRASIALRDNERFAAAVSLSATKVRLAAFSLSGALAGLAGCLYAVAYRGIPFGGFAPVLSLQAFTMVVVGGMGSLWGAVLGAVYVYTAQYFLGATAALITTGGGILMVLTLAPGGLADLGYRLRDRVILVVLRRRGLSWNDMHSRSDDQRAERTQDPLSLPADVSRQDVQGLLEIRDLAAGYGHLQILFGVSSEVIDGEVFALLGTNGAGKSTILKVVAGLVPAWEGQLLFDGEDITRLSAAQRVARGIVLVPGGRGVFGTLSVAENLRLAGWTLRSQGESVFLAQTQERIFELFPVLRERLNQRASLMSGGEQQMLTIAQALLCRPRLLMIDELSLGLAPAVVGTLLQVVRDLNGEGMTIVLVEQSMNIAASIAPRSIFLEKGEVRFRGATKELASQEALVRSVFLANDRPRRPTLPIAAATDPTASVAALEIRGLSKSYGGVTAVKGVDLQLFENQILGVIGANGAGKTTLFDIICGFVAPDSGHILLHNRDVTHQPAARRFAAGLGRTFQDLRLIPSLTVTDVLAVALERHIEVRDPISLVLALPSALVSEACIDLQVDELMETFHLERYASSFISELSTGTRRIVELAAACAHRPSVLILDEPSSGLAQKEAEAMVPVLLDLKARTGATIAIIEHDIPMIRDLSDEIVCMHLGGVLARGSADQVLSDPAVISSYLGVDEVAVQRSGSPRPAHRSRARAGAVVLR